MVSNVTRLQNVIAARETSGEDRGSLWSETDALVRTLESAINAVHGVRQFEGFGGDLREASDESLLTLGRRLGSHKVNVERIKNGIYEANAALRDVSDRDLGSSALSTEQQRQLSRARSEDDYASTNGVHPDIQEEMWRSELEANREAEAERRLEEFNQKMVLAAGELPREENPTAPEDAPTIDPGGVTPPGGGPGTIPGGATPSVPGGPGVSPPTLPNPGGNNPGTGSPPPVVPGPTPSVPVPPPGGVLPPPGVFPPPEVRPDAPIDILPTRPAPGGIAPPPSITPGGPGLPGGGMPGGPGGIGIAPALPGGRPGGAARPGAPGGSARPGTPGGAARPGMPGGAARPGMAGGMVAGQGGTGARGGVGGARGAGVAGRPGMAGGMVAGQGGAGRGAGAAGARGGAGARPGMAGGTMAGQGRGTGGGAAGRAGTAGLRGTGAGASARPGMAGGAMAGQNGRGDAKRREQDGEELFAFEVDDEQQTVGLDELAQAGERGATPEKDSDIDW